jgi:exopolyphosphatase/guanosine-5'-triphosphate,3'-diphosphate pyrophosphatase
VESHEIADLRLRSVLQLLARFQHDEAHPRHVAELALQLFDGFARAHRLDGDARDLLHYAALLHDVGSVVGYDRHAEHSHYIIQNGGLRGFSGAEIDVMGLVARYHGKAKPRRRDASYDELPKASRRVVRWLAALLRIAEGLDRSHYQRIRRLRVRGSRGGYSIRVTAARDAQLEVWAGQRRTDLLESLLKKPVRIALAGRLGRPSPRLPGEARSPRGGPRTRGRAGRAPRGPSRGKA